MNDLATILAFCLPSVGFLILGYWMQRHYEEVLAKERDARSQSAHEWLSLVQHWRNRYDASVAARYLAEREASKYRTALRGELTRQANAELIRPDEPVGVGKVLEFSATGRGGRRSK